MSIELKEARSLRDIRKFVRFPFKLYQGNDYWVPSLIKGEVENLRADRNPAFDHCDARYMLAYRDGEIVGRIAGIINHRFIEKWDRKYARFCWFEFIDDLEVSGALLADIEAWARSKGMEGITGPIGFTTFEQLGILIYGFDELPTFSSTYNHPYYPDHMEHHGYGKDVDYVEYEVASPSGVPEKVARISDITRKRLKLKLLQAESRKDLLPYAKQVFDVINAAYDPLFGFVPLTGKQVDHFVKKYFSFILPEYTTVVLDRDGQVVGFQISMPSLSRAFQKARGRLYPFGFRHLLKAMKNPDRIDILLVGIRPEYQGKGVNALFMTEMTATCAEKGIRWAESNSELEENIKVQNFWRYFDARHHKRKRVFMKAFEEASTSD